MPTYEFRCPSGHSFERFYRKIGDAVSELECPVCGQVAVRQLSGGAGLVFKGSGFYLTDYGRNAHRKEGIGTGRPSEKSGGGESSSDAKGESKSDAKAGESKSESASSGDSKRAESSSGGGSGEKSSGKSDAPSESPPKKPGSSGGSSD
jgi:putative FmdB family regulatory protein